VLRPAGQAFTEHTDDIPTVSDAVYDQLEALAEFSERNRLSAENGEFPYVIRDKMVGLGSRRSHRAVFTIMPHPGPDGCGAGR